MIIIITTLIHASSALCVRALESLDKPPRNL
jgi:hypothetical protein